MKKTILTLLFSSFAMYANAWEKNKCPADQAACFKLSSINRAPPPPDLDSGRVVFAFGDGDGCLASAPVYSDASNTLKVNPGIKVSGARNGHCAYNDQLNNAYITYQETVSTTNSKYKARVFGIYAVKDQIAGGPLAHRHDLEHAILWLEDGQPKYMSVSQHSDMQIKAISQVPYLKNNKKAFAAKYIQTGSSHYLVFADGVKDKNNDFIPVNTNPTPNKTWFGSDHNSVVDFNAANATFKSLMSQRIFGDAVPRFNDRQYLNDNRPNEWKKMGVSF